MMDFVDVLVEWTPMQRSVSPVVPCILEDEEDSDLVKNGQKRWKGHSSVKPKEFGQRMEEPGYVSLVCIGIFHPFRKRTKSVEVQR